MTREEQIKQQAMSVIGVPPELSLLECFRIGFKEGAKWADEHPNLYNDEKYHTVKVSCLDELNRKAALYDTFLDKACKWLKENIDLVAISTFNVRSEHHEIVMMNFFERKFREAMEE